MECSGHYAADGPFHMYSCKVQLQVTDQEPGVRIFINLRKNEQNHRKTSKIEKSIQKNAHYSKR